MASSPSPFDDVREAFSDLDTSEKAAFVFEATFDTLGQALAETGRNVATFIDQLDVDSWFRDPEPTDRDFAAPPPPPPTPPRTPSPKTTTKPKAAKKPPTPTPPKTPPSDEA